jgi:DNA-binding NarL/FixJ family response regulator
MKTTATRSQTSTGKRKIMLVDDHPVVREGLAAAINEESDFVVCAKAPNGVKAMQAAETTQPDVAIVDISLEGRNGLELIKDLRARYPKLPIMALSMHDEELYAERVLAARAQGYVMKREPIETVLSALRRLLQGGIFLSEKMTNRIVRNYPNRETVQERTPVGLLSDRELEVFHLVGQGLGTSQIASQLNLSMKTVSCYRQNIKAKLQLQSATEVVRFAVHWARANQVD